MGHVASLSQLQTPSVASVNGVITPYRDVTVHIGAEALTRALSIFEGVKGYWDADVQQLGFRCLDWHYARLCRSAALLYIPVEFSYDEYVAWILDLARHLAVPEKDLWLRTTMFVTAGHWGEGTHADLVTTGFTQTKDPVPPMRLGVSSWRRAADTSMPARIKSAANYQVARIARIEGNQRGLDDMVLLNEHGRVAEATGACIVMARGGVVVSPPASEGALESLTVDVIAEVCEALSIPFERRPIERSELLIADELGIAGTISELTLASDIDGYAKRADGLLARVREHYVKAMRREVQLPGVTFVELSRTQLQPALAAH